MKLLLDTHTFLWGAAGDERLSRRAARAISDPRNDVLFSVVSAWEIVLKATAGKLNLPESPERYIPSRLEQMAFRPLPLALAHTLRLTDLPDIHRDPFDRLLVAQALVEELALVSGDPILRRYPVKVVW